MSISDIRNRHRKEADFESEVVKYVESLGGHCVKLVQLGLRGWPDRTVFLPGGRVVLLELKASRGRLSPQQKAWLAQLTALGFPCGCCWNLEQVKALCEYTK